MRRRIRLTGRKQLARSAVTIRIVTVGDRRVLTLRINDPKFQKAFPFDARILLRLQENKFVELVDLGTIGDPKLMAEFNHQAFSAPACQLRVASSSPEKYGLLLGSTDSWTLLDDEQKGDAARRGILLFLPAKTAPRAWKLDIRDDDYPIVQIDERIEDARTWAKTNPVFVNTVLPAILRELFDYILQQGESGASDWTADWLSWADTLMPGSKPPFGGDYVERRDWLDRLMESFCLRHGLGDQLVRHLKAERAAAA